MKRIDYRASGPKNEPNGIVIPDANGRNLRDLFANNDGEAGYTPDGQFWSTLLSHNCTGTQDPN